MQQSEVLLELLRAAESSSQHRDLKQVARSDLVKGVLRRLGFVATQQGGGLHCRNSFSLVNIDSADEHRLFPT